MNLNLLNNVSIKQLFVVIGILITNIIFGLALYFTDKNIWLIMSLSFSTTVILVMLFYIVNDMRWNIKQSSRMSDLYIEALLNIHNTVHIKVPLPPMDEWAMSPHSIVQLINQINRDKPQLIVELGSGLSTIIAAYCLRQFNSSSSRLISFDHDLEFLTVTANRLIEHGLNGYVQLVHTPLTALTVKGRDYTYYDYKKFQSVLETEKIDMLIIDGPPIYISDFVRYPAVPLLWDLLKRNALIILDDYDRAMEKEIVRQWRSEYGLKVESIAVLEQAIALRKN